MRCFHRGWHPLNRRKRAHTGIDACSAFSALLKILHSLSLDLHLIASAYADMAKEKEIKAIRKLLQDAKQSGISDDLSGLEHYLQTVEEASKLEPVRMTL